MVAPETAFDVPVVGLQGLDDHLLLAEQLVDEQANALSVAFDHHDQPLMQLPRCEAATPNTSCSRIIGRYSPRKDSTSPPPGSRVDLRRLDLQRFKMAMSGTM